MAPTGSSIFSLSTIRIEKTTSTPAIMAIDAAPITETTTAPGVIPTSLPESPFNATEASRLVITSWVVIIEASAPEHAEIAVVTKTYETPTGSALRPEPPLNPNQPIQSKNTPTVARGMLCAGIPMILPFTNFPDLAPSKITQASPAAAPTP